MANDVPSKRLSNRWQEACQSSSLSLEALAALSFLGPLDGTPAFYLTARLYAKEVDTLWSSGLH